MTYMQILSDIVPEFGVISLGNTSMMNLKQWQFLSGDEQVMIVTEEKLEGAASVLVFELVKYGLAALKKDSAGV